MKNLFVCHTQIQLVLALGLVNGRYKKEINDLILFEDFSLSIDLKESLIIEFDKVLFRKGCFPEKFKKWRYKLFSIPADILNLRTFLNQEYTRVFEVCDTNIQEIYILKRAYKNNPKVDMVWLEDGTYPYYINTHKRSGLNSNEFTISLRKIVFRYLFRLGRFYDFQGSYMSGNRNLKYAFLTLKGMERDIFKNKTIFQIDKGEYIIGLSSLYQREKKEITLSGKIIVLALDKLDTYRDITLLKEQILRLKDNIFKVENGFKLYYKYHPKEEGSIEELADCNELDRNKGIEYYYTLIKSDEVIVLGCKSTALFSARILEFKSVSIACLISETSDDLLRFYNSINVLVPENYVELCNILELK
jgi:hypothetical protein